MTTEMLVCCLLLLGSADARQDPHATPSTTAVDANTPYRIGPDDVLAVSVLQATELNQSVRVSALGDVSLPLIGTVRAAGLTPHELERDIEARFREKYIRDPDVQVLVTEVRSRGVSIVGSVRKPGIVQATGAMTLLDVISIAGGVAEDAGDRVVVTNPARPAPIAIGLKALMESRDPAANVPVQPGDVVNVHAAALVYVVGAVQKPGAFAVRGNEGLTVLRAMALGEGLLPVAAQGDAVIVRTTAAGERIELPVDLGAVLKGKQPDVPLEAQDVLFVPTSGGKTFARGTLAVVTRMMPLRWFF